VRPITGLVLGSVLIPLGLGISLTWLPSSVADAFEYGAATACREPAANGSGCWTEVSAVVTGTQIYARPRGNSNWVVDLTDQYGRQRPQVAHRGIFNRLTPGEPVSVRFWKGRVVLIHVPGGDDLPTDTEPGRQIGMASLATVFTLLAGSVFFLGALGVHRDRRSWTVSVSRYEFGRDMVDAVAPAARRWVEAVLIIGLIGIFGAILAHAVFGASILFAALVCTGLGALLWAWSLHHRARMELAKRVSRQDRR
jgi:hypothetical protein